MMDRRAGKALRAVIGFGILLLLAAGHPALAQGDPGPGEADRALVRYADGGFELLSLSPLTSFVPPSDALPSGASLSGFWYELQDAAGETLYRRIIGDPVRVVFEGPAAASTLNAARMTRRLGADPSRRRTPFRLWQAMQSAMLGAVVSPTIADSMDLFGSRITREVEPLADPERIEAIPEERHFTLLIPAAQEGDQLVLFSSPIELGTQAQAAAEVARFSLQAGR